MTGPRPGQDFAGYRVEEEIGRGGMARVFRATRLDHTEKVVALKVISLDLAEDEEFRKRFIREARLAAQLDHPNVLAVHEAREHDGVLFMAMQFVRGHDLGKEIEGGRLSLDRAVAVAAPVADALAAAHAEGLVHRDVKPGNILVRERDDWVFLSDFGIARSGDFALTSRSRVLGTPEYMAPEQARGKLDARSDIYALGCVVFEALTGRVPFPRDTPVERIIAHFEDDPPRLADVRPDLPRAASEVVERAMAKDPAERYGSAADLAEALRGLVAGAGATTIPLPPAPKPTARRRRRRTAPALAGVAAAGLVAAIALVPGPNPAGGGGGGGGEGGGDPPPQLSCATFHPPDLGSTTTADSSAVTQTEADAVIDRYVRAVNDRSASDLPGVTGLYAHLTAPDGTTADGWQAVRDSHQASWSQYDGLEITDREYCTGTKAQRVVLDYHLRGGLVRKLGVEVSRGFGTPDAVIVYWLYK